MVQAGHSLTGLEKASVLLKSLGPKASEEVLKRLTPAERDLLDSQILSMREVKSGIRDRVLGEVEEAIRLSRTSDLPPFRWLEDLDSEHVAGLLRGERPQTIALVLSYLTPAMAGSVLARLDQKSRNGAAQSMLQKSRVPQDVVSTVDDMLRRRDAGLDSNTSRGTAPILQSLGKATVRARESVMAAISRPDQHAHELASLEDLVSLPESRLGGLLGEVDVDDLCLALRVASDELRESIMRNVPVSTASLLRQRLASTAQVKIREIELAQKRVLGAVCRAMKEAISVGASYADEEKTVMAREASVE